MLGSVFGGVGVGVGFGKLQLVLLSTNDLSQPLTNHSCRKRSMPSEQRSAMGHQTHSKPMSFDTQLSHELKATQVGSAVK